MRYLSALTVVAFTALVAVMVLTMDRFMNQPLSTITFESVRDSYIDVGLYKHQEPAKKNSPGQESLFGIYYKTTVEEPYEEKPEELFCYL